MADQEDDSREDEMVRVDFGPSVELDRVASADPTGTFASRRAQQHPVVMFSKRHCPYVFPFL